LTYCSVFKRSLKKSFRKISIIKNSKEEEDIKKEALENNFGNYNNRTSFVIFKFITLLFYYVLSFIGKDDDYTQSWLSTILMKITMTM